jgi:thiamine-phosphate pyrophosphorylase
MTCCHIKHNKNREIPRVWLMTDPRLDDDLMRILQSLPFRSGVIFRHYNLEQAKRRKLFGKIARICRRRGHVLLLAGSPRLARQWRADGVHNRTDRSRVGNGLRSAPVHNANEIAQARRNGANIMLLSPLFTTRSHPGVRPLGLTRFPRLAAVTGDARVIALGGMNARRMLMLTNCRSIHGWAGIDAFGKSGTKLPASYP